MKKLFELFISFAKIGLFTFGGGYAMISLIDNECVEKKKWITHDEMMEITVIAESTPGPIAINCATYVGYKKCGIWGAIFATIGVILPSFVIIYIISIVLNDFFEYEIVDKAFRGIQIAVAILIINAACSMISKMNKELLAILIMIITTLAMLIINVFSINFSSIILMLISGAVNLVIFIITNFLSKKGGDLK